MNKMVPTFLLAAFILLAVPTGAAWAAEAEAKPGANEEPAWKADIRRKLDQRITFCFHEQPLTEILEFFHRITDINIVVDRSSLNEGQDDGITLRVTNTPLRIALTWTLRDVGLTWELRDHALYVYKPRRPEFRPVPPDVELHVTLPNGATIEANGAALQHVPTALPAAIERALDPAADGIVTYRLSDLDAQRAAEALRELVPAVTVRQHGGLLAVTGEPQTLRQALAIMRAQNHFTAEAVPLPAAPSEDPVDDATDPTASDAPPMRIVAPVVAVRPEEERVVIAVGTEHGATPGMTFDIHRKDRLLGTVELTEVNEKVAEAHIEQLADEARIAVDDIAVGLIKKEPEQPENE